MTNQIKPDSAAPGAVRLPKDYEWDGQSENMKWFAEGYNSAIRDIISINTCVSKLERITPSGDVERRARELLAAELGDYEAECLLEGIGGAVTTGEAISAIIAALSAPKQVGDSASAPLRHPIVHGWHWHWNGEVWQMLHVWERPGHSYLAVQEEHANGKRHFRMTSKMGGDWYGPITPPALSASPQPAPQPVEAEGREAALPMDSAPHDGTIVRLLVQFTAGGFEDVGPEKATWTIGQNGADHHPEDDEWLFAGWNWEQDCFTQGEGTPIGWLPMIGSPPHEQPAIDHQTIVGLLRAHRLMRWQDDAGNQLPLVDHLTPPGSDSIRPGLDEIEQLADELMCAITDGAKGEGDSDV